MSTRYKAVDGSELGHSCCFKATVVDTEFEASKEEFK